MAIQEIDTQYSKKKKKKKKKTTKKPCLVSVGTKAPLEGDVHFIGQRTEREVEENFNFKLL